MRPVCHICPRHCSPEEGKYGYCRARRNEKDHIICKNYGWLTALALDPVEKKPLRHFYPGRLILSAGSYGCNLRCPFCQNHQISMTGHEAETMYFSPESLVQKAVELKKQGNIG